MKFRNIKLRSRQKIIILFDLALLMTIAGCSVFSTQQPVPTPTVPGQNLSSGDQVVTKAVVTFNVTVPSGNNSQGLSLDFLDEVTGLALNPTRYEMKRVDDQHYTVELPITIGSIVKYRYSKIQNIPSIEYQANGQPVRYRLYFITGPGTVNDIVSAWSDHPYNGQTGRISGKILITGQNEPIPNILVEAGGMQTLTGSDGSFLLEGLPPGEHNMCVFAMDGEYQTVQQGAIVAPNANTPALLSMAPAQKVKVTFNLTIPQEALNVPVRIAGSLQEFGNTFADLSGGMSVIASRMPVMSPDSQGKLALTITLPEGAYLEYKYTLGDGFWNSEHNTDGKYKLRQLIVPTKDTIINDTVDTWKSPDLAPITFNVKVPNNTPASDFVSIQFNPYTWTEPIPMWSLGNETWMYILYSPFSNINTLTYRYCRNDQCGSADDQATIGTDTKGSSVKPGTVPQTFQDEVKAWAWWAPTGKPTTVASVNIKSPSLPFMAGVEFLNEYNPSWQPKYLQALQDLHTNGANWVILDPSWTFGSSYQPVLQPFPGYDPLWTDLVETIDQARAIGLKTALYPQPHFAIPVNDWWKSMPRDIAWWQAWFDLYQNFILNNADLATKTNSEALILGGDWLLPAIPQGKLQDGTPSNVPGDAETRWRELISQVRARFKGSLIWAISYPNGIKNPPPFLDSIDSIYVLYNASLAPKNNPSEIDLENTISGQFDQDLMSFYSSWKQKPLIIGIDYPSINGSASACVQSTNGMCLDVNVLDRPNPDIATVILDLQSQTDIYNAFMTEISSRDWINGFISRGFYPPAALQDKSSSLHGKPAYDVLTFWFTRLRAGK